MMAKGTFGHIILSTPDLDAAFASPEAAALVVDDGTWAVTGNGLKVRLNESRQRNEWVHVRLSDSAGTLTGNRKGRPMGALFNLVTE